MRPPDGNVMPLQSECTVSECLHHLLNVALIVFALIILANKIVNFTVTQFLAFSQPITSQTGQC